MVFSKKNFFNMSVHFYSDEMGKKIEYMTTNLDNSNLIIFHTA